VRHWRTSGAQLSETNKGDSVNSRRRIEATQRQISLTEQAVVDLSHQLHSSKQIVQPVERHRLILTWLD
jgi:hypothetical protein